MWYKYSGAVLETKQCQTREPERIMDSFDSSGSTTCSADELDKAISSVDDSLLPSDSRDFTTTSTDSSIGDLERCEGRQHASSGFNDSTSYLSFPDRKWPVTNFKSQNENKSFDLEKWQDVPLRVILKEMLDTYLRRPFQTRQNSLAGPTPNDLRETHVTSSDYMQHVAKFSTSLPPKHKDQLAFLEGTEPSFDDLSVPEERNPVSSKPALEESLITIAEESRESYTSSEMENGSSNWSRLNFHGDVLKRNTSLDDVSCAPECSELSESSGFASRNTTMRNTRRSRSLTNLPKSPQGCSPRIVTSPIKPVRHLTAYFSELANQSRSDTSVKTILPRRMPMIFVSPPSPLTPRDI